MIRKALCTIAIATAALLVTSGYVFAETYQIDPVHSSVAFSVRHIFSQVPGKFTDFSGAVQYEPDHPEKASVEANIKTASINTGNERRDGHLRSPDFLDVEKHPEISFKSTSVKKGEDRLMVTGDLTMHGVTKTVTLPVEVLGVGTHPMAKVPVAGFSAGLSLKRSDYGVNNWADPAGVQGDEVRITLNIEAVVKKAEKPSNPSKQ